MSQDLRALSRYLSYLLRHHPEAVGLSLDPSGWVPVEVLLVALAAHGRALDGVALERLVSTSDKQRFELRDGRIRAAQGHSVPVDLALPALAPPDVLYHGTAARFLPSIRASGLEPRGRRHVHLSADAATATTVGARHGRPVVLRVDAAGMHAAGYTFHRAANGVWLTAAVPVRWIVEPD
jgi:putative RNA 2'-phosphotransferase